MYGKGKNIEAQRKEARSRKERQGHRDICTEKYRQKGTGEQRQQRTNAKHANSVHPVAINDNSPTWEEARRRTQGACPRQGMHKLFKGKRLDF